MTFGRFLSLVALLFTGTMLQAQLTYNELKVAYDSAWTFKNLQVIPIKYKTRGPADAWMNSRPLTFAEALQKRRIKLQEVAYQHGADVNLLQVTNHSRQRVIVQSGELLRGGKQDRMVGETKIIEPGATDYINVYCVEKRRWDDKPKEFEQAGAANSEVRKAMDLSGRQSDIWREIDKQYGSARKKSETWSFLQLYPDSLRTDTTYVKYFMDKYKAGDSSYAGFIFISGKRILSTEIFAAPALVSVAFANMLSSYVQSAIQSGAVPNVPVSTLTTFMDKVLTNEEIQKTYVTTHGKLHKSGGKVLHLVAYPD